MYFNKWQYLENMKICYTALTLFSKKCIKYIPYKYKKVVWNNKVVIRKSNHHQFLIKKLKYNLL